MLLKEMHANEHSWNQIHMISILYNNMDSIAEFQNKKPSDWGWKSNYPWLPRIHAKLIFRDFSDKENKELKIWLVNLVIKEQKDVYHRNFMPFFHVTNVLVT